MSHPPTYNHLLWISEKDLPLEIREAVIWRLGTWGNLPDADWKHMHEFAGAWKQSVQEFFEAERLRWAVNYLLSRFEGTITAEAAFYAVALVACKSPARVKQVYYRRIRKDDGPYDIYIGGTP